MPLQCPIIIQDISLTIIHPEPQYSFVNTLTSARKKTYVWIRQHSNKCEEIDISYPTKLIWRFFYAHKINSTLTWHFIHGNKYWKLAETFKLALTLACITSDGSQWEALTLTAEPQVRNSIQLVNYNCSIVEENAGRALFPLDQLWVKIENEIQRETKLDFPSTGITVELLCLWIFNYVQFWQSMTIQFY